MLAVVDEPRCCGPCSGGGQDDDVSQRVVGGWREWVVEFGWVVLCLWAGVLTGVGVLLHLAAAERRSDPHQVGELIELRGPDASHLEQLIDGA